MSETFNKEEYWKRRKQGLRGQGDKPEQAFEENPGHHLAGISNNLRFMNRRQARRKIVDRTFTRKGYAFGRKMSSKS